MKKRRIAAFLFTCLFSVCIVINLPIHAHAAPFDDLDLIGKVTALWNEVVNNGAKKSDIKTESKKGVEDFYDDQKTTYDEKDITPGKVLDDMTASQIDTNNALWTGINGFFTAGTYQFGEGESAQTIDFDVKSFISEGGLGKTVYDLFSVFGYSLVLLFFAVSLIDQTVKYEIFTLRGFVNIFGRLLISKVIIDLSGAVCISIISISQSMCTRVIGITKLDPYAYPEVTLAESTADSGLWIIGPVLDVVMKVVLWTPMWLIALVVLICGIMIMAKLLFRSFELTMLTVVSPAFFACTSSSTTMPYFRNFISTFLQSALQIIFMAIVYVVALSKIQTADITSISDVGAWFISYIPKLLIIIAMAIMIVKPPRVLTGLIR